MSENTFLLLSLLLCHLREYRTCLLVHILLNKMELLSERTETARTSLIHNYVPLCFWVDVVISACYLTNRMPSSVLQYQSHYSVFYQDQSLFSLPLHMFGCTLFITLPPEKINFNTRPSNCVFLMYSRLQREYKYFDLSTNKYLISADVSFFETSPHFLLIQKIRRP